MKMLINGKDPAALAAREQQRMESIDQLLSVMESPLRRIVWAIKKGTIRHLIKR
ncbi:hypothetical protein HGI30_15135 [Paenibacillus albicereus]|uniref:Uncharacterized protein n=1 Tax=Paenibacillus albicereus TaxID=2726185 RepID=A0A6H2H022_9BACL|nr:hypothetical protein [Paenibacillus albicereus]QJC52766.1 hypothetical protein HGI30_15135 [Paenibacillus albicereus]